MFDKIWQNEANSKGLYTLQQINEVKEKIKKIHLKIEGCEEVICAFESLKNPNEKRIKANQDHILKLNKQIEDLEEQLKEMEAKSVNKKRS